MERKVYPGEFYRHFKNKLYQVLTVAEHTETGEPLVIYQALYGEFRVYARPMELFLSPVDRQKYPEAEQKYRFEKVTFESTEERISEGEDQEEPNPDLLAFLDAEAFEDQMKCLAKLEKTATQKELNSVYVVLDMKQQTGPLEAQFDHIRRYLTAQHHFDGDRLR